MTNMAGNVVSGASGVKDTFQRGYHGENYQDVQNKKLDKQWRKDSDTINYYKRKYKGDWKQKMDQAADLRKYGITDQKELDRGIKLKDRNPNLSSEQVANIMQIKDMYTQDQLMKSESRNKVQERISNMLNGNQQETARVMDLLDQVHNLK